MRRPSIGEATVSRARCPYRETGDEVPRPKAAATSRKESFTACERDAPQNPEQVLEPQHQWRGRRGFLTARTVRLAPPPA